MSRNKTRKFRGGACGSGFCQMPQSGGGSCRIGMGFPKFGGKSKPENTTEALLNVAEAAISGGGCGCGMPQTIAPMSELLKGGGGCPCQAAPKFPTALGGYRATKRNLKYLKRWKQGKSIGFTMRSSLKAKGLIPRSNGKKRVSNKYRK